MGSSRKLIGKALGEYKKLLFLTPIQKDILVGSILGDGNLRILKKEACLTISHGENQVEYLRWKYKIFQDWVLTEPRRELRKYYKNKRRYLISWRWSTISHSAITRYFHLFYANGKKRIPDEIDTILTSPLALAIWYMDDGSRKPCGKGAFLHTQSFSVTDQQKLIKCLKKNFGINLKLSSAGLSKKRRLFRLYITAGSFLYFRSLIKPYVLPEMLYKISS